MADRHQDGLYEELLREVSEGQGDIPLVYDSMALGWDEVKVLKDMIEDLAQRFIAGITRGASEPPKRVAQGDES